MYTEASSPRQTGDVTRLISTSNSPTTGSCIQFYYHMYGTNMGTLNIYAQSGNARGNPLWTKTGNQGNKWIQALVTVKSQSSWKVGLFR